MLSRGCESGPAFDWEAPTNAESNLSADNMARRFRSFVPGLSIRSAGFKVSLDLQISRQCMTSYQRRSSPAPASMACVPVLIGMAGRSPTDGRLAGGAESPRAGCRHRLSLQTRHQSRGRMGLKPMIDGRFYMNNRCLWIGMHACKKGGGEGMRKFSWLES